MKSPRNACGRIYKTAQCAWRDFRAPGQRDQMPRARWIHVVLLAVFGFVVGGIVTGWFVGSSMGRAAGRGEIVISHARLDDILYWAFIGGGVMSALMLLGAWPWEEWLRGKHGVDIKQIARRLRIRHKPGRRPRDQSRRL